MKNKFVLPLVCASIMLLAVNSCTIEEHKCMPIDSLYPIVGVLKATEMNREVYISLYVIDSCEYIGYVNAFSHDFLTHKGNCKFCAERSKK